VIVETDNTGTTLATYTYDPSGALFSMTRGGATYFYHLNARGDVVALTDSSGAVVNTYTYDPWGAPLTASETVENPYRYASYRYDTSTGLYYCWNRHYAPELARFLTRDIYPGELADPVTMNPYLYCGGDPVNAVDPSGMMTAEVALAGAGAWAIADGPLPIGEVLFVAAAIWVLAEQNAPADEALQSPPEHIPDAQDALDNPGCTPEGWNPRTNPNGNWTRNNPDGTKESLRPDQGRGTEGPHLDWKDPNGDWWRVWPDRTMTPK